MISTMNYLLLMARALVGISLSSHALAQSSGTVSATSQQCPTYREFDYSNPNSHQFGAPDGCACLEGTQELNCGFCTGDAPCQATNSSHICRTDMVYRTNDAYKAYQCRLSGSLGNLLPGGKVSVYADVQSGTVDVSVFNRGTLNDPHALDCHITGCQFTAGSEQVTCNRTECTCTDQCNSIVRNVVENMLSGKPAEMMSEPFEEGSEHVISIKMEGAPVDVEAICSASACTSDRGEDTIVIEDDSNQQRAWKPSASFSLLVLATLTAGLGLLAAFLVIPACCTNRRKSQQVTAFPEDTEIHTTISSKTTVLEFRNITRIVPLKGAAAKAHGENSKIILQNISGSVRSGNLMGIMGPSGAGKSSLLNVLAAVDNGQARNSGKILLNGKVQKRGFRNKVAFVQQDDCLFDTLTVRECIEYSALLRLPNNMTTPQKQAAVWNTLEELHLTHVSTNRITNVSGGQRKRVSIGMELVTQPSVLFLDEPSSGLDAYAANQIMNVLSELAHRNRIVILSIHQPSMRSFLSMDQILLLGAGQTMYNGSPAAVGQYLDSRGFPCSAEDTVADHMLEVVSQKENHDVLTNSLSPSNYTISAHDNDDDFDDVPPQQRSILNELMVLLSRASKDIFRNRELFVMQLCLCILLALFVGGIFEGITNDLAGFQNRMGAFYFSLSFFAFASFSSMDIFVKERSIFVRETGSKYHRAATYFVSKSVLDMYALRIIPVSVFVCIFYWMMGLKSEVEAFVVFWVTLVLFNMCAGIMSICISISAPTVGQANLIASVWFLLMLLFGGFLVNVQTMGSWYAWLRYLSIFYYSFEILMTNELTGLLLSFDAPGYPTIPIYGEVFLKTIGMDEGRQTADLICLCSLTIGFSVLAYLLLLLRVPSSAGKHFQRMHNENKRLPPEEPSARTHANSTGERRPRSAAALMLDAQTGVTERLNDEEAPAENDSMLDEDEAPPETASILGTSPSCKVTTSVLSGGSAESFWTCISPSSSLVKDYEYA